MFGVGRPFDQLRVLVAQGKLNFKLVCTHAGILTGEDGMSAHGIEDLALACSLPGFTVICPADTVEAAQAIRAAAATKGPFYVRLSRAATPVIHSDDYRLEVGKAHVEREGSDVAIVGTGVMVSVALEAADLLAKSGISARVVNMHTLTPAGRGHAPGRGQGNRRYCNGGGALHTRRTRQHRRPDSRAHPSGAVGDGPPSKATASRARPKS